MTTLLIRLFIKNNGEPRNPVVRNAYGRLASIVGICCNVFLFLIKLTAGAIAGSIAIMADAVNNLSDASGSIVALIGFKISAKPADKGHPFGHARFEYISGLAVTFLILIIGVELGRSSIDKIIAPTPVDFSYFTIIILLISIGVKLWMMLFNKKIGRTIESSTLTATAMDSRNDVITTSAVLLAGIIGKLTQLNIDGYVGLCVAVFILISGFVLMKDTIDPLIGVAPKKELVNYIREKIMSYSGVLGTHDLAVHDYGPGRCFASVHVEMAAENNVMESHDIIDNIEREFLAKDNIKLIIHYDPILTGDEAVGTTREWLKGVVKNIGSDLSIHDFRMVQGISHTNLIFDIVVPYESNYNKEQLLSKINCAVKQHDEKYYTVITVDDSYTSY